VGELVLITGTSSGIGLSAGIECAAAGHRVVATMRNLERRDALEKAAASRGVAVHVEALDVTGDVDTKLRELTLKYGPFFAIVNNAGIAVGGAFEEQSDRDIRDQFETNVFGMMAVIRAALPSLRSAQRGRIINISSISGQVGLPVLSTYAATKHAVEGFSEGLRWELGMFGIDVCLVEPGNFKTPIYFENQRRGELTSLDGPYGSLLKSVLQIITAEADKAPEPLAVARAICKLVDTPSPPFRTVVGNDARMLMALRRMIPDRLFASGVRRRVGLQRLR
jgi:NAD(P)-dependent dehydrogenase (short-subunit alcohol dehydrogenase family)